MKSKLILSFLILVLTPLVMIYSSGMLFSQSMSFESATTLEDKYPTRDTLTTVFTWIIDDGEAGLWNNAGDVWVDSFKVYNQVATVSVIGWNALQASSGDSTSYLADYKLRALVNRGWEMQGHGYSPGRDASGAAPGTKGLWRSNGVADTVEAMHRGEVLPVDYDRDARLCRQSLIMMGLPPPRGWSSPNYSTTQVYKEALAKNKFDFGFQPDGNATGQSGGGSQDRYNWLTEVYFSDATKIRGIAAYPNVLPPRYEIQQSTGEADSEGAFRQMVWDGIAKRGSWVTCIFHSPQDFEAGPVSQFENLLAFIDSVQTIGLIDVMTASDAFDLFYNTPIGESANFIYPNFPDHNNDGVADGMLNIKDRIDVGLGLATFTSPGTRDSVFHSLNCSAKNHGAMGQGYAAIFNGPTATSANMWGSTVDQWFQSLDVTWQLPNAWRGNTIVYECWVQIDPSIEDVDGTPLSGSDSVAVVFYAAKEKKWNQRGVTSDKYIYVARNDWSSGNADQDNWCSMNPWTGQTFYSNFVTMEPADTVGGDFQHLYGTWVVPTDADYVRACFVKDSRFDAGSVRISNISISLTKRVMSNW
jgi:hypothetical protein